VREGRSRIEVVLVAEDEALVPYTSGCPGRRPWGFPMRFTIELTLEEEAVLLSRTRHDSTTATGKNRTSQRR
jgi:hypothetical protein